MTFFLPLVRLTFRPCHLQNCFGSRLQRSPTYMSGLYVFEYKR